MRALGATMTLGLLLVVGVGSAAADSPCMQDAKEVHGQCRMECDEDFVIARDLCRNIDPECAAGCRAESEACRAPVVAALEQCVDGCRDQLNTERAACPRRGRGRDFCVDRANIRAFLCRDECRDGLHVHEALQACRQDFNVCMNGCGIPTEPTPAPPVPTVAKTEAPLPPTVQPTEPPQPTETPRPTRTATPKPDPTLTPVVPR